MNVNYLNVRELGIVNIDVADGTTRLDSHAGLQEAFVEYKIRDLSPNYDFLSVRAGIQGFSSDFRGFIFVDEQPGVRLFGNLHSDRWEYNAAYFNLLEKNTNSGLNTFALRHQQVIVANWYLQDFIKPGYTTAVQHSLQQGRPQRSLRRQRISCAARARSAFSSRTKFARRTSAGPATAISAASM